MVTKTLTLHERISWYKFIVKLQLISWLDRIEEKLQPKEG